MLIFISACYPSNTMALKHSLPLAGLSLFLTLGAMPALAISGFAGPFAPSNFTFRSDPSEAGNVGADLNTTNAASGEVTLFGPDDAFNSLGTTSTYSEWTITIDSTRAGSVSFGWQYYNEFDTTVGNDGGGYVLNGTYFELVSNSNLNQDPNNPQISAAPVVLNLVAGDTFGFRASSLTNTGGEGVFTVTNFHATPVPLETDALPVIISAGFMGGGVWLKRRKNTKQ
ncbi:MAG: hypothetical protein GC158_14590 [Cyanobacteria bacterium RI_101]|nr:hypothetical protein [Cyanobacteria bacterium RI_101]